MLSGLPTLGHKFFAAKKSNFRIGRPSPRRGGGRMFGNPKLGWRKIQGTNHGLLVPFGPGVNHSTQTAPNDDISAGDDFGARVHVPNDDHVARILYEIARPERPLNKDGGAPQRPASETHLLFLGAILRQLDLKAQTPRRGLSGRVVGERSPQDEAALRELISQVRKLGHVQGSGAQTHHCPGTSEEVAVGVEPPKQISQD